MSIVLSYATIDDAPRIAEIHIAAFGSNAMLLAQFPTSEVRAALKKTIELKAREDINDPKISVLVVRELARQEDKLGVNGIRDEVQGSKIISFAKWSHPVKKMEGYAEPQWVWPEGTETNILEMWAKRVDEAHEKIMGSEPCYHLSFIGTDPQYQRRGAASLLLKWGLEQCILFDVPAYLESTVEARILYERNGFLPVARISLSLEEEPNTVAPKIYEEIGYIFRPERSCK